jgi:hypothetical protein
MSYLTNAELIDFIDERIISDLCTDNGVRPSLAQVLVDPNVTLACSTASGMVNSAALTAQRYSVLQLTSLTGDDSNLLKMIVAWLAFGQLCMRRGRDPETNPAYKEMMNYLVQIRRGDNLFNVPANVGVGVPAEQFPTAVNYQTVNTVRTATNRYFPTRRNQNTTS